MASSKKVKSEFLQSMTELIIKKWCFVCNSAQSPLTWRLTSRSTSFLYSSAAECSKFWEACHVPSRLWWYELVTLFVSYGCAQINVMTFDYHRLVLFCDQYHSQWPKPGAGFPHGDDDKTSRDSYVCVPCKLSALIFVLPNNRSDFILLGWGPGIQPKRPLMYSSWCVHASLYCKYHHAG